jgi:hypothetical protein
MKYPNKKLMQFDFGWMMGFVVSFFS